MMQNLCEMERIFPPDKGPLEYLGLLTAHLGVREAEEEASYFISKKWTEISCDIWEQHYDALDFFNIYAYYYFLPSIIFHSYANYDQIDLAIIKVINDFLPEEPVNKRNIHFIFQFNPEQLCFIINWLNDLYVIYNDVHDKELILAAKESISAFSDPTLKYSYE